MQWKFAVKSSVKIWQWGDHWSADHWQQTLFPSLKGDPHKKDKQGMHSVTWLVYFSVCSPICDQIAL